MNIRRISLERTKLESHKESENLSVKLAIRNWQPIMNYWCLWRHIQIAYLYSLSGLGYRVVQCNNLSKILLFKRYLLDSRPNILASFFLGWHSLGSFVTEEESLAGTTLAIKTFPNIALKQQTFSVRDYYLGVM
jgi:hypothetical protein